MHTVAVLAPDGVSGFDLSAACQVFASARLPDGSAAYEVRVCAAGDATSFAAGVPCYQLRAPYGMADAADADTIVVPGIGDSAAEPPAELLALLRAAAGRGARVVSICTGAFVLAAAGLLDGLRATTHWALAGRLAERYPRIEVDPSVLFVDNGRLLTAAGAAAGLDMCLHLVRTDHGARVAAETARLVVMPLQRGGGQAQFIAQAMPEGGDAGVNLQPVLEWMQRNVHRALTLDEIAHQAHLSVRSLNRRFRAQTGTTPVQWFLRARIHHARALLESTDLPVEQVAAASGFRSPVTLRLHFRRQVGTSPVGYRTAFRPPTPQPPA
ncbi:GlxA family transcriptional regulator [Streptomyces celluloflavus]|uniref:GlxA family transcriptional regulator n=1 Tax=Streptomyces celluloflavus TaxID=58344 RepID=A0ABW7RAD6_9ACTN|nr:helix-turn-helix domain-containing protein [Streptomyces celluloflavus]